MTISKTLMLRLEKLAGPRVPACDPLKVTASAALHRASRELSKDMPYRGREQWLERCAEGRPTPEDTALLDQLPHDALEVAGVTAIQFAAIMTRLDREF